uniref:Nuclear receptor domain-containing protein n=1 Tax=Panagrolaimus sp. ES5 TaxID=591445 RepID=A0AC34G2R0_9BILA
MDLKECEICGDEKDVSRHYGVACSNRNRCRYCRYQKCLKAGMSEDNFREPYCATKVSVSDHRLRSNSPTESLPSLKTMSIESKELITFLKSMTKSTIENIDPAYENITFDEALNLPINREISLSDALKNPHFVVPKVKFNLDFLQLVRMTKKLTEMYEIHIVDIFQKLKPDDEEMALGMALMLFQFSESLSNEGH